MVPQDETLHSWGWTALHHAVWNDHTVIVKLLLAHGADVDAADSEVGKVISSLRSWVYVAMQ